MRKIKVLEVCYSLKAAGIESFCNNMQKSIDNERFEIHYAIYKDSKSDFFYKEQIESNGGIVQNLACHNKLFLLRHIGQRINFYRIVKQSDYDIVHVHASSGLQALEGMISRIAGVDNIIYHSHSSNLSLSSKFFWLKRLINNFGLRWINKNAKVCIACSSIAGKWLFNNREDIIEIKNGIVCEDYKFDKSKRKETRLSLDISDDEIVIGHIGAFSEIKNQRFIVDIYEELKRENPKYRLILVGDGHLRQEIIHYSVQKDISDILFLGTRTDCNNLLCAFDCFVFPSLWEGMPLTLIEAQASGLTCMASDTISREANLFGLVSFLSLNMSAKDWAQNVTVIHGNDRENAYKELSKYGYDMRTSTREIEKIYSHLMELKA